MLRDEFIVAGDSNAAWIFFFLMWPWRSCSVSMCCDRAQAKAFALIRLSRLAGH